MENNDLNLFKLQYSWYEGEFESCILATTKEKKEIEEDLKEAVSSVKIDEEKEKDVDCLPTAYWKIRDILEQKGYIACYFIDNPIYFVEDGHGKSNEGFKTYEIHNKKEKIEWKVLK